MEIALLLHLYQPVTQSRDIFKKVYEDTYVPLIKKISRTRGLRMSISLPLSLLEQMDRYGYGSWIKDFKELVDLGKIEIVGTAAYHPILSKFPADIIEKQIILNEYGVGYYFGDHRNLEGEESIMVKNLLGFFPPELSINELLLITLDKLRYNWVIVDETSIPYMTKDDNRFGVYSYENRNIKIVCRNRSLSNILSFKRDTKIDDITSSIFLGGNKESFAVVLDGEYFGHHFNDGFVLINHLMSLSYDHGIEFTTVSDYVENSQPKKLDKVIEGSWGATDEEISSGNLYPMWYDLNNEIHELQWKLIFRLIEFSKNLEKISGVSECGSTPIWKPEGLKEISDVKARKQIAQEILLLKALHSDQFWWASKKTMPMGEYLYSPPMVLGGLSIVRNLVDLYGNNSLQKDVTDIIGQIEHLIESEG